MKRCGGPVTDDIRGMTAQLAADPSSLVFLRLGDALRRRGQLDAAQKVAQVGLGKYPYLPDAHDLLARILVEREDLERAFDEWDMALQLDPDHAGAHKGIGFLYFKAGDLRAALEHLEAASRRTQDDARVGLALERIRTAMGQVSPPSTPGASPVAGAEVAPAERDASAANPLFVGFEGAEDGLLLLDQNGLRLGGGLKTPGGSDVADTVAAHLAGVSREATRDAKILELGAWQSLAVELTDENMFVLAPTPDSLLLLMRDKSVPMGRLAFMADRAARVAREWLGGLK